MAADTPGMLNPVIKRRLPHRMVREVIFMPWRREDSVRVQCYPGSKSTLLRIVGGVLIAGGVLLFLFCVPTWAWLAVLGAAMILLGLLLIRD